MCTPKHFCTLEVFNHRQGFIWRIPGVRHVLSSRPHLKWVKLRKLLPYRTQSPADRVFRLSGRWSHAHWYRHTPLLMWEKRFIVCIYVDVIHRPRQKIYRISIENRKISRTNITLPSDDMNFILDRLLAFPSEFVEPPALVTHCLRLTLEFGGQDNGDLIRRPCDRFPPSPSPPTQFFSFLARAPFHVKARANAQIDRLYYYK